MITSSITHHQLKTTSKYSTGRHPRLETSFVCVSANFNSGITAKHKASINQWLIQSKLQSTITIFYTEPVKTQEATEDKIHKTSKHEQKGCSMTFLSNFTVNVEYGDVFCRPDCSANKRRYMMLRYMMLRYM